MRFSDGRCKASTLTDREGQLLVWRERSTASTVFRDSQVSTKPSISVVVPTWNRADLLPATLASILKQDSPPSEVIVVDDGSEDNTAALLEEYKSKGIRSIRIANSGDLRARNVGLEAATGTLVAFCDSDDLWKPNFLSTAMSCWREVPDLCAVYSDFQIVRSGTWEASTKFDAAPPEFWKGMREVGKGLFVFDFPIADRLVTYQPFFPSALVADRSFLLRAGGWDEGTAGLIGRDFATAMRIAEYAPLGVLCRPLVGIRKHTSNDSGDVLAMNLGDSQVLEYILRTRPSMSSYTAAFEASMIERRRGALDIAFARKNFELVGDIAKLLPPNSLSGLNKVKTFTSALPEPLRRTLAEGLMMMGTVKSRLIDRKKS